MIGDAERVQELERENAELRECVEKAELAAAWTADKEEMSDALAEAERARDEALVKLYAAEERLARYEAPGPALLTAKHSTNYGEMCRQDGCGSSCTKPISDAAYREQHARCVAVVEARLARYEAPGPALLVAEHDEFCIRADDPDADGECTMECQFAARQKIAREQHARCVAVVELMRNGSLRDYEREMLDEVLAALTEGAKP